MASVATWRSPVLLIHGDDDRNVPFANRGTRGALRRQKVDFEELIFQTRFTIPFTPGLVRAYSTSADSGSQTGTAANPQH